MGTSITTDERQTEASWKEIAEDAIALLNHWDEEMWKGPGRRVMAPDLADLHRRVRAITSTRPTQP